MEQNAMPAPSKSQEPRLLDEVQQILRLHHYCMRLLILNIVNGNTVQAILVRDVNRLKY